MPNRTRLAVLTLTALVTLTACGATVTSGTITGKDHDNAEVKTTRVCDRYTTTRSGTGKRARTTRTCAHYGTRTRTEPESWEFTLRDKDGNTGEVDVTEDEYDRYQVGDKYPAK